MRLLQTEIDVTPGNAPNLGARPEGWVGMGSAVIEITNAGDLENAFVLRVECDHAYFQPSWLRFDPLPPQGDANRPPVGKPDLPGPKNSTLKLHLGTGSARQAMLSFRLPRTPEARAGVYPLKVIVETAVPGANKVERFTEFNATLIVRPFYEFSAETEPSDKRVGRIRRHARFAVRVTNRGNDWLYVDVKGTKSEAMDLDVPALRLAVPPPEPGATSERTMPLEARTRLKTIKGDGVPTALPIEVVRVDAPTVPPLAEEAMSGGPALLGSAVVVNETRELAPIAAPAELVYHPPIPGSLIGFFQAVGRNVKGLVASVLALVLLFTMGMIVFERGFRKINSFMIVEAGTNKEGGYVIPNGGSFTLRGEWLDRSVIELYTKGKDEPEQTISSDDTEHVTLTADKIKKGLTDYKGKTAEALSHIFFAKITPSFQDKEIVKIVARRRLPILGALGIFDPARITDKTIYVGAEPVAEVKRDGPFLTTSEILPGSPIILTGSGFGAKGKATVGGVEVGDLKWSDNKITIPVPTEFQTSGQKFAVVVTFATGEPKSVPLGELTVKAPGTEAVPGLTPNPGGTNPDGSPAPGGSNPGGSTPGGNSPGGSTPGGNAPGGSTPGGTNPAKNLAPLAQAPSGYTEALAAFGGSDRGWTKVADAVGDARDAESIALKAYALASLGRADDALALIKPYLAEKLAPREKAYLDVATSRILERQKAASDSDLASDFSSTISTFNKLVDKRRAEAASTGRPYGEGDAFPVLAYGAFLQRSGFGKPATAFRKLKPDDSSDAERKAAQRIQSPS